MFKMLIGMTFVTVIADSVLTGSAYKKYVKAIIGLFVVMTIVQGISGIKNIKYDDKIFDEIENDVSRNIFYAEEEIKKEMLNNAKSNIIDTLKKEGIEVTGLDLDIDGNYNITHIKIILSDSSRYNDALSIMADKLYINKSVIEQGEG